MKDLETSSISTNSAEDIKHQLQPKDLLNDGAITTGVNSLLLLNSREGSFRMNKPSEYFTQRKEN